MESYAQVIIDISLRELDRPFTYRIPEELQERLRLGSLVVVPFGSGNRTRKGYVIAFTDHCDLPQEKIKDIAEIAMQGTEETGGNAIRLAAWMQSRYGGTLSLCLKTVLTGRRQAKAVETRSVTLLLDGEKAQEQLDFYLQRHQVARARLLQSLMETPTQPWQLITNKLHVPPATIRAMERQEILRIDTESSLRNPVVLGEVEEKALILSPEQQAIVDGVLADFRAVAASCAVPENGPDPAGESACPKAASDSSACSDLSGSPFRRVSLLHGITGSGKTEVYIAIIERIVAEGRQAIMLIPEISLTYQTLIRFYRHFGDRVSVMNSSLSEGEKSDQFERARRGEIDVIIGPRSALFTPFPKLGVIVMDEEHESSYKNESMPKYHAREVAEHIALMHGAVLVLGSATPSVDSYHRAQRGEYRLYTLKRRLTGGTLPSVAVTDMREELLAGNRSILSRLLADRIEDRLERGEQTMLFLNRRGFSGFVVCRSCGYVPKCPHCSVSLSLHGSRMPESSVRESPLAQTGDERLDDPPDGVSSISDIAAGAASPDLSVKPLSRISPRGACRFAAARGIRYAGGPGDAEDGRPVRMDPHIRRLVCHYCGYEEAMPQVCPECGSVHIGGLNAGTEQIQEMLQKVYPQARVLRMDADTTKTRGSYEKLLTAFANEEADILVGTQMIVKGHDFPNVTLVGALLADMSLYSDDYRAAERTFQLLTQAAGRAGRGSRPGQVVIQTYEPTHYSIVHAAAQDYEEFYREEIGYRRILQYPPMSHLLAVQITSKNEDHAQIYAGQTRELLEKITRRWPQPPVLIGPAAPALARLRDEYRYALYIKSEDYDKLIICKDRVEAAASRARAADPGMDTQFQFDFDPVVSW